MSNSRQTIDLPPNVWLFPDAREDLAALDKGRQTRVIIAFFKIAHAPKHAGKPLENQQDRLLAGYRSAYIDNRSIRIVWTVSDQGQIEIAVIAAVRIREGLEVYRSAASRRSGVEDWILKRLADAGSS